MTGLALRRLDDDQAWAFGVGARTVVVDPWLSPRYRLPLGVLERVHREPPADTPQSLPRPDAFVVTAHFEDHLDRATLTGLAARFADVPMFTTRAAATTLRRLGWADVRVLTPGDTVELGDDVELTAVRPGFPYRTSSLGLWLRQHGRGGIWLETHVADPATLHALPDDLDVAILPVQSVHLLGVRFAMSAAEATEVVAQVRPRHVVTTGHDPEVATGPLSWLLRCRGSLADFHAALAGAALPTRLLDAPVGAWVTVPGSDARATV